MARARAGTRNAVKKKPTYQNDDLEIRLDQISTMLVLNQFTNQELDNVRYYALNKKLRTGEYYAPIPDGFVNILDAFIDPSVLNTEYPEDHINDAIDDNGYLRGAELYDHEEDEVLSYYPYLDPKYVVDVLDYVVNGRILGTVERTLPDEGRLLDSLPPLIPDPVHNSQRIFKQLAYLTDKGIVPEELDHSDYSAVDRWAGSQLLKLCKIGSVVTYPTFIRYKSQECYAIDRLDMLAIKHYYPTNLMEL